MLPMLLSRAIAISTYSFAAQVQENLQSAQDSTEAQDKGEKTFTFHRMTDGKENLWKVIFKDGKVVELYKNGSKIPDEKIGEYRHMIDDELADLDPDSFEFPIHHFNFYFDRSALDSSLKQLETNLSHKNFSWVDSAFNSKKFRSEMDSLRKNLRGLRNLKNCLPHKFNFHSDTSAFNKGIGELKKNFGNLKLQNHEFGCDRYNMKHEMRKFREQMRHDRFNCESFRNKMHELENQMKKFGKQMKHMDLNMNKLDKKMEKLNSHKQNK